jgi:thymidylate kinase
VVLLVTGVTGSGKSTVARRMAERGHRAVSLDAVPGLCRWTDADGRRVERPADPDAGWLADHRWTWDPARLSAVVADHRVGAGAAWLCGYAANAADLGDLFDAVFLLVIDDSTMARRIRHRPGGNDFGRAGDTLLAAAGYATEFLDSWRERDIVAVDAARPVDDLVGDLLAHASRLPRISR